MSEQGSMAGKLRVLGSNVDNIPEQTRLPVAHTGDPEIDDRIGKRRSKPSYQLREMANQARQLLDDCHMRREAMMAWGEAKREQATEAFSKQEAINQKSLEFHEAEIAKIRQMRHDDAIEFRQKMANINTEIENEIAAVDAMTAAQQGVLDIASKHIDPAPPAKRGKAKA